MSENRIIKFRIWDKKKKYFWFPKYNGETIFKEVFNDDDSIPLQFIGLKDKNNKEIYEGDIINLTGPDYNFNYVIIFQDGAFRIAESLSYDIGWRLIPAGCCKFGKVIGNIFENPELLKS